MLSTYLEIGYYVIYGLSLRLIYCHRRTSVIAIVLARGRVVSQILRSKSAASPRLNSQQSDRFVILCYSASRYQESKEHARSKYRVTSKLLHAIIQRGRRRRGRQQERKSGIIRIEADSAATEPPSANGRRSLFFPSFGLLLRLPVSRERPRDSGSCPVQLSPFRPAGPFRSPGQFVRSFDQVFAERRTPEPSVLAYQETRRGEARRDEPRRAAPRRWRAQCAQLVGRHTPWRIPYSSRGRPSTKRNDS